MSRLAAYLEREQQSLTEQWLLAVRADPLIDTSDKLTHQQLVDHLPQLYVPVILVRCGHQNSDTDIDHALDHHRWFKRQQRLQIVGTNAIECDVAEAARCAEALSQADEEQRSGT